MRSDNKKKIKVCHGARCLDYGGQALAAEMKSVGLESEAGECQSLCPHSPVVHLNEKLIPKASIDKIIEQL
ncbi:(2Fe-2S) ferredoxin domain-containing protein [Pseudomonadota bacterium]